LRDLTKVKDPPKKPLQKWNIPFRGSSTFVRSLKFKFFLAKDKDSRTALGSSWILKTGPENLGRALKLVH
jgi:hypothetical protein